MNTEHDPYASKYQWSDETQRNSLPLHDPYNSSGSFLPPPKFQKYRKIFIILLCIALISCSGVVFYFVGKNASSSVIIKKILAKTSQTTAVPTTITTAAFAPPYLQGLSSTNPNIFLNAFADALSEQDVTNIEQNTDVAKFYLSCAPEATYPTSGLSCGNEWKAVRSMLLSDELEFNYPQDAMLSTPLVSMYCSSTFSNVNFTVLGGFDNKGSGLPLSHIGQAIFTFVCTTCGSETQWAWNGVYLC